MAGKVLALIHGALPQDRFAVLGSLVPAFGSRGFEITVCSLPDGDPRPDLHDVDVVCVAGSGESVYDESLDWIGVERALLVDADARHVPTLGVCFGGQLLADALGGAVLPGRRGEYGFTSVRATHPDLVGEGPWFAFHHDVMQAPEEAQVVAVNDIGVQAFTRGPHLGVQFHPEVTPECFRAWRRRPSGRTADDEGGVDVAALEVQIAENAVPATARCDALVGAFLERAGR